MLVIGLGDHGDKSVDELVGIRVPFVGAEKATHLQAGRPMRSGEKYCRVALGATFTDDRGDDDEELVTCVGPPAPPRRDRSPVC